MLCLFAGFSMMSSKRSIFTGMTTADSQLLECIKLARSIPFPIDLFPEPIVEWLMALAFSVNTRPEFILIAAVSVVSTLMGPATKIRIRNRYTEPCNLYTVCLSEPGAGKSQAFEIAVERPIRSLKEPAHSLIVHDFTRKGLFQHLVSHQGRALLAHSEMSSFYELILKKQQEGYYYLLLFLLSLIGVLHFLNYEYSHHSYTANSNKVVPSRSKLKTTKLRSSSSNNLL